MRLLCTIFLLEIALGGGGRWLELGLLTPRMGIWGLAVAWSLVALLRRASIDRLIFRLSLFWALLLSVGALRGILAGAPLPLIVEDIKPLSFFWCLPFLALAIRTPADAQHVLTLWRWSGVVLACAYLALLGMLWSGILPFEALYTWAHPEEIRFRGEIGLTYKGFLYLGVGALCWLAIPRRGRCWAVMVILTAMVLTFTRGFLLAFAAVTVAYFVLAIPRTKTAWHYGTLFALVGILGLGHYLEAIGSRDISNLERLVQLQEVWKAMTPWSALVGHGFGVGVPSRVVHMDISYLEVMHKQGLFGLLAWGVLLALVAFYGWRACRHGQHIIAVPFLLSTAFVAIQTATNPFLNNPIGMSILLVSLVTFINCRSWNDLRTLPQDNSRNPQALALGRAVD